MYNPLVPPLPAVPDAVKLVMHWDVGSDLSVSNEFHMAYSGGPPSAANLTAIATALVTAVTTHAVGLFNADVTFTGADAIDLSSTGAAMGSAPASLGGAHGGTMGPASACATVEFQISRRYRGGRPRVFLPWLGASDLATAQTWSGTIAADVTAAWGQIIAALSGLTEGSTVLGAQISVSYFSGFTVVTSPTTGRTRNVPKPRVTPLVDPVVSAACQLRVGSQRRRL